ncbi:uncharacterized protein LOC143239369 isoform X2 [Tachypleus tridentatus]|uniref:uncharacterized protein LOC143239369 isoform X2 n=1 Tax=Tachypleus tridentatus TaxID=6853 RepID=UPI003FD028B4
MKIKALFYAHILLNTAVVHSVIQFNLKPEEDLKVSATSYGSSGSGGNGGLINIQAVPVSVNTGGGGSYRDGTSGGNKSGGGRGKVVLGLLAVPISLKSGGGGGGRGGGKRAGGGVKITT